MDRQTGILHVIYGDFSLGVNGETDGKKFAYIFNYGRGGMESMVVDEKEWLYRTPKPTFWRALTDNDRGNQLHLKSGMWLAADTFIRNTGARGKVDGQKVENPGAPGNKRFFGNETAAKVEVEFDFETITVPAAKVTVGYRVEADGSIVVKAHYFGQKGLPEFPVFGMRFLMPTAADGFTYEGLSGETYPDRMAGGIKGVYEVEGLPVTPYLVPQDCGMHMDTEWVKIFRTKVLDNRYIVPYYETSDYKAPDQAATVQPAPGHGSLDAAEQRQSERSQAVQTGTQQGKRLCKQTSIQIEKTGKPFAFSCLPYTAEELENALHIEELPPVRRTVLCVYGAVRGVGGIDSWGAQPEPSYHISAEEDQEVEFRIRIG